MNIDEWLKRKKRPTVRKAMDTFLRGLAKSHKNNCAKLRTIIKYRDQLGPEWCLKVTASLDDIIEELQRLRAALEDNSTHEPWAPLPPLKIGQRAKTGIDSRFETM